jgi:hypothetical protein
MLKDADFKKALAAIVGPWAKQFSGSEARRGAAETARTLFGEILHDALAPKEILSMPWKDFSDLVPVIDAGIAQKRKNFSELLGYLKEQNPENIDQLINCINLSGWRLVSTGLIQLAYYLNIQLPGMPLLEDMARLLENPETKLKDMEYLAPNGFKETVGALFLWDLKNTGKQADAQTQPVNQHYSDLTLGMLRRVLEGHFDISKSYILRDSLDDARRASNPQGMNSIASRADLFLIFLIPGLKISVADGTPKFVTPAQRGVEVRAAVDKSPRSEL